MMQETECVTLSDYKDNLLLSFVMPKTVTRIGWGAFSNLGATFHCSRAGLPAGGASSLVRPDTRMSASMETISLVELAFWKLKLSKIKKEESSETGADDSYRSSCHSQNGADTIVVIKNVIG